MGFKISKGWSKHFFPAHGSSGLQSTHLLLSSKAPSHSHSSILLAKMSEENPTHPQRKGSGIGREWMP